jgi:hypothetical protein
MKRAGNFQVARRNDTTPASVIGFRAASPPPPTSARPIEEVRLIERLMSLFLSSGRRATGEIDATAYEGIKTFHVRHLVTTRLSLGGLNLPSNGGPFPTRREGLFEGFSSSQPHLRISVGNCGWEVTNLAFQSEWVKKE